MSEYPLAERFGGVARFRALHLLFAEPGRCFGQRELTAEAGIDPGNVARLLKRWTAVGLVQRHQQDGVPRYCASADPSLAALATLIQQDGPVGPHAAPGPVRLGRSEGGRGVRLDSARARARRQRMWWPGCSKPR